MNLCLFPVDWKKVFGGRFQMVYLLSELVPGLTRTLKGHYRNNNKAAASFAQKLPGQGPSLWNTVGTRCQTIYVTLEALKVGVLRWAEGKSCQS